MQTEQLEKQNWMSLSGRILEGGFELKDLIEADENRALFRVRVLGDRELVATGLFRRADPTSADRQVELWQTVRELRDPRLNSPLGCGTTDLNGSRTVYVVLRQPDETLAGVLRERPLTPAEMKDALLNIAKALEVLHLNGLVHGNLSPAHVVAIGDSIRLSGEGVRFRGAAPAFQSKPATYLAPESNGTNLSTESDIWCLGATVFETLSQKPWAESEREKIEALPEPFATIALRCLVPEPAGRCHLAEVVALARGEIKPSPRPKPVPAPRPAAVVLPINERQGPEKQAQDKVTQDKPTGDKPTEDKPPQQIQGEPKDTGNSGLNGPAPAAAPPASQPKVETGAPRPEGLKAQSQAASASGSAPAAVPVTNGTVKRESPIVGKAASQEPVGSRPPDRRPTTLPLSQPEPKVKPINQGPAPAPFPSKPVRQSAGFDREETRTGERSPKIWIWAGIAVLAVLLLIWALRPKHSARVVSGPAAPAASTSAQSRPGGNAWETKTIQPDGTASNSQAPAEARTPRASAAAATGAAASNSVTKPPTPTATPQRETASNAEGSPVKGNVWRTVLYTYNRQSDADEKAKALNAQHADLHADVFSPSGRGPYLVCAGGRMSREEAVQMRKLVVGLGLPHDSYIQNFKH